MVWSLTRNAEAGLIESTLLDPNGPTSFYPNSVLTRETLVIMKASIDARGEIPAKTVADVQRMWRFKDAAAMPQMLIDSLAYDYDLAERSVVSRSLPRGLLFLKDKQVRIIITMSVVVIIISHYHQHRHPQVSNVEALVSCWFIGIGRGRNGPSCGIDSKSRAPRRERRVMHDSPAPSLVTRHTSHVTRHASRVTRHTSHVTRHTSHVTRHTSHFT